VKYQLEEMSSDPIVFITEPDVHNLIFKYVSGSDVINILKVSTSWHKAALRSPNAMRKLKVVVYDGKSDVAYPSNPKEFIAGRIYRAAKIMLQVDGGMSEKMELLEILAPTLEELEIVCLNKNIPYPRSLKLPKLRKLSLVETEHSDTINFILMTSDCLESVQVNTRVLDTMFEEPIPAINARLTSISLGVRNHWSIESQQVNFENFLYSMSSTLTSFDIDFCSKEAFTLVLSQLPVLNRFQAARLMFDAAPEGLTNYTIRTFVWNSRNLPKNALKVMKNLDLIILTDGDVYRMEAGLRAGPHITTMTVLAWRGTVCPCKHYKRLADAYPWIPKGVTIEYVTCGTNCV
jgi:hypothetical protein